MITLTKFDESDYDCFGGVETNDYMQDGWITWELQYFDYETNKNYDACLVLDGYGLAFDYSDYDTESICGYTWKCNTSDAVEWMKKFDNDSTLELKDFLGNTWKPQTDNPEYKKFQEAFDNYYAPNGQPNE